MSPSVLTALPASFPAGTTVELLITDSDFPANQGWAMQLILAGASKLTVDGQASGAAFAFTLSSTATAPLKAGRYHAVRRATKAGKSYDSAPVFVDVTPNIAAAGAGDMQSYQEKMLAAIEAELFARANGTAAESAEEYEIDGIMLKRCSRESLRKERSKLVAELNRARTGSLGKPVKVTFGSTPGNFGW